MAIPEAARRSISMVLGLGLIGLIGWGLFLGLRALWTALNGLNPTVSAAILASVATVLVSVISVLVSKYLEQRNAINKELRDKKAPVYEDLIELIFRVVFSSKMGLPDLTEAELTTRFSTITRHLIIWGADEVVSALYKFRLYANAASDKPALMFVVIEEMFLAIRRDLGHSNRGLTSGKIMGTFINDIHKLGAP